MFQIFLGILVICKYLRIKLLNKQLFETLFTDTSHMQVPRRIVYGYIIHKIVNKITSQRFAARQLYFPQVRAAKKDVVHALVGEVGGAPLDAQRLQVWKLQRQETERFWAKVQALFHVEGLERCHAVFKALEECKQRLLGELYALTKLKINKVCCAELRLQQQQKLILNLWAEVQPERLQAVFPDVLEQFDDIALGHLLAVKTYYLQTLLVFHGCFEEVVGFNTIRSRQVDRTQLILNH